MRAASSAESDGNGPRDFLRGLHTPFRGRVVTDPVERVRRLCLALPEAEERETWENPTFRVRDKIFAMMRARSHAGSPELSVWVKAPPGSQEVLVGADPGRFFRPPYVGPKGWVGIRLADEPDWHEVGALVRRSYGLVAPKRLAAARLTAAPVECQGPRASSPSRRRCRAERSRSPR